MKQVLKQVAIVVVGFLLVMMTGPILFAVGWGGVGAVIVQLGLATIYLIGVAVYVAVVFANRQR